MDKAFEEWLGRTDIKGKYSPSAIACMYAAWQAATAAHRDVPTLDRKKFITDLWGRLEKHRHQHHRWLIAQTVEAMLPYCQGQPPKEAGRRIRFPEVKGRAPELTPDKVSASRVPSLGELWGRISPLGENHWRGHDQGALVYNAMLPYCGRGEPCQYYGGEDERNDGTVPRCNHPDVFDWPEPRAATEGTTQDRGKG